MSSEQLQRTTYRDPTSAGDPIRTSDPVNRDIESARDMEDFYLPLARIHGSGLHGWGIASGLGVTATLGSQVLNVLPGVAIDSAGQHISLAVNGEAEIGLNAADPGASPNLTGVASMGAVISTVGLSGTLFLTIQFWEWFQGFIDPATDPNEFFKFVHTPWLRLQTVAPIDGSAIVLAQVTLDLGGQIIALSRAPGLGVFLPAESIYLSKAVSNAGPGFSVDSGLSGTVSSHPAGGILLKGQSASDAVHFVRADGSESVTVAAGNGLLAVGAPGVPGTISVADWNTSSVVLNGERAAISVGRPSNSGEVDVYDGNGNLAVASDGARALFTVGGTRNPGVIRTFDDRRNTTVQIDGGAGSVAITGIVSAQGIPLMGNPARKVASTWMFTTGNGRPTYDIDLGRRTQFTAFGSFVAINSTSEFDYDNEVTVEVYKVDGITTSDWLYQIGGGSKLGPLGDSRNVHAPFFSGVGRIITFRIQGIGPDVNLAAIGIVFFE